MAAREFGGRGVSDYSPEGWKGLKTGQYTNCELNRYVYEKHNCKACVYDSCKCKSCIDGSGNACVYDSCKCKSCSDGS